MKILGRGPQLALASQSEERSDHDLGYVKEMFSCGLSVSGVLRAILKSEHIKSRCSLERRHRISRGAQSAILEGATKSPSPDTLRKMAEAMEAGEVWWSNRRLQLSAFDLQYLLSLERKAAAQAGAGELETEGTGTALEDGSRDILVAFLEDALHAIQERSPKRAGVLIEDTLRLIRASDMNQNQGSDNGEPRDGNSLEEIVKTLERTFITNARQLLRIQILQYLGARGLSVDKVNDLARELTEDREVAASIGFELGLFLDSLAWHDAGVFALALMKLAYVLPAAAPERTPTKLLKSVGVEVKGNGSKSIA